jgi:glycosyltransferase involved in cell wall biosynthesis
MIRVLFFCEFGIRNGGENSLLAVLPRLRELDIEPVIAVPSPSELARQLRTLDVKTVTWDPQSCKDHQNSVDQRREMIQQLIEAVNPLLVHANSLSMSRLCGPVASQMGVASLGHLRDMMNLSRQAIDDLNHHQRLLAVSEATRDWYQQRGVDSHRLHVLYNGVDLEQFFPQPASGTLQQQLGLPEDAPILGGIGQIALRKGWEILLEAMEQVRKQFPQVHLVIVGERHAKKQEVIDYHRQLIESASRPELQGHVHFLGRRDDVASLLRQWTMLVHPARQEPLGRVLLEAAASGCPVVATDVGGTREIFPGPEDGGMLVASESPGQMANAICQLLAAPQVCHSLGQAGRRRAGDCFGVRKSADRLVQHYREVSKDSPQKGS